MAPVPAGELGGFIRDVPDFPKPGIVFKDITPLLADPDAFASAIDALIAPYATAGVEKVVGIEARGFILGAPVAQALGAGFVPVRKPGKLPWQVASQTYALEYGTDQLEVHRDAVAPGERVLLVDDVLATGGTAAAALDLLGGLGAEVVGAAFLIELGFLGGRAQLGDAAIAALVTYP
jgi:adenine phosphoribosyltransferase